MTSYIVKNVDKEIQKIKEMTGDPNVRIVVMHYYGKLTVDLKSRKNGKVS